jgi:hypothetical protein
MNFLTAEKNPPDILEVVWLQFGINLLYFTGYKHIQAVSRAGQAGLSSYGQDREIYLCMPRE